MMEKKDNPPPPSVGAKTEKDFPSPKTPNQVSGPNFTSRLHKPWRWPPKCHNESPKVLRTIHKAPWVKTLMLHVFQGLGAVWALEPPSQLCTFLQAFGRCVTMHFEHAVRHLHTPEGITCKQQSNMRRPGKVSRGKRPTQSHYNRMQAMHCEQVFQVQAVAAITKGCAGYSPLPQVPLGAARRGATATSHRP